MALRQLARDAAGLLGRRQGSLARHMSSKVNQVTGAPMELFERKVR